MTSTAPTPLLPDQLRSGAYAHVLDRAVPILMAAVAFSIPAFSNVPPNLVLLDGEPAFWVFRIYGCLMLAIAWWPHSYALHRYALPLGILAWGGRGGGFLELVLNNRLDLMAAVLERIAIVTLVSVWHYAQVRWYAVALPPRNIE